MLPCILAYIDPGSGSLLFQMVIATALAVSLGLRQARQRAASILRSLFGKRGSSTEAQVNDQSRN